MLQPLVLSTLLASGVTATPLSTLHPDAAMMRSAVDPGDEDEEAEGVGEPAADAEADPPKEEAAKEAPPADAPAAITTKVPRYNQWHVLIAPGVGYVRGPKNAYSALGPSARIGAWKLGWRNHFLIGGGPSLVYGFLFDRLADDTIHFFTVNGDLIIGGGKADKIAVYGHLTLGAGVLAARDGATKTSLILPGIRAAAGVGVHGYVTPRISIGGLADFGYVGGLGVDAFVTLGIHFGKKEK